MIGAMVTAKNHLSSMEMLVLLFVLFWSENGIIASQGEFMLFLFLAAICLYMYTSLTYNPYLQSMKHLFHAVHGLIQRKSTSDLGITNSGTATIR